MFTLCAQLCTHCTSTRVKLYKALHGKDLVFADMNPPTADNEHIRELNGFYPLCNVYDFLCWCMSVLPIFTNRWSIGNVFDSNTQRGE